MFSKNKSMFAHKSVAYRNDLECRLYYNEDIACLEYIKSKTDVTADNENILQIETEISSKVELVGYVKNSELKFAFIEMLSVCSYDKGSLLDRGAVAVTIDGAGLKAACLDDFSLAEVTCVFIEQPEAVKAKEVLITKKALLTALNVLKEKKRDFDIEIAVSETNLFLKYDNIVIGLGIQNGTVSHDLFQLRRKLEDIQYDKPFQIRFPDNRSFKDNYVSVGGHKILSKVIREIKKTGKNFEMSSSNQNVYRIRDNSGETVIYVAFPIEAVSFDVKADSLCVEGLGLGNVK